jgi:hypothetical protein
LGSLGSGASRLARQTGADLGGAEALLRSQRFDGVCPKIVGQLLAVVLQSGKPDKIGTHPFDGFAPAVRTDPPIGA